MAAYKTPPCPVCGVWECLDCGARTARSSRYFPGKHHCRTCKSLNGRMLPVYHRPDIYETHAADVDPQGTCYYPLDDDKPTTQPGHIRPTGRNPMSTSTSTPVHIDLELQPADWGSVPELPSTLGSPTVDWSFNDQGKIETDVSLVVGDEDQTVSFWDSDLDGVVNTADDVHPRRDPWGEMNPAHREAALEWGKEVHRRICSGVEVLVNQAAGHGSDPYRAIVAYASGDAGRKSPS